jgi:hypothetical protein
LERIADHPKANFEDCFGVLLLISCFGLLLNFEPLVRFAAPIEVIADYLSDVAVSNPGFCKPKGSIFAVGLAGSL